MYGCRMAQSVRKFLIEDSAWEQFDTTVQTLGLTPSAVLRMLVANYNGAGPPPPRPNIHPATTKATP